MAAMKRNVNLEEIDTDAFMGITYLKNQSPVQKFIFIAGLVMAIAVEILGSILLNFNGVTTFIVGFIPLLVSVAFGCNYNEDFSLIEYIMLIISSPTKEYFSNPYEDLEHLHSSAERIRQEELLEREKRKASDEEQRKLLIRAVIAFAIFVAVIIVAIISIKIFKTTDTHHVVTARLTAIRGIC